VHLIEWLSEERVGFRAAFRAAVKELVRGGLERDRLRILGALAPWVRLPRDGGALVDGRREGLPDGFAVDAEASDRAQDTGVRTPVTFGPGSICGRDCFPFGGRTHSHDGV
jgi:hypothetical protein